MSPRFGAVVVQEVVDSVRVNHNDLVRDEPSSSQSINTRNHHLFHPDDESDTLPLRKPSINLHANIESRRSECSTKQSSECTFPTSLGKMELVAKLVVACCWGYLSKRSHV